MTRDNHVYKLEPILATKLHIPRSLSDIVHRPRLIQRLQLGLQAKLTYIIAPAGCGKSTLLATWAEALDIPAAWISLDASDNDLVRFWRYLISGINTISPASHNQLPTHSQHARPRPF